MISVLRRTATAVTLAGLMTAAVAGALVAESEGEARVRAVFEEYKAALLAGNGERAAALVDASTFDYWQELRRLALTAGEEELRERSFIERLLVLSLRQQLSVEELQTLSLEALLRRAIEAGWIAEGSIAQLEIGAIVIEGDEARAEALTRPLVEPSEPRRVEELDYRFVREDGEWRFAFASLVAGLDVLLRELTTQLGTEEDALIFTLVESFSGQQVMPEIWQPPLPAEGEGEEPPPRR